MDSDLSNEWEFADGRFIHDIQVDPKRAFLISSKPAQIIQFGTVLALRQCNTEDYFFHTSQLKVIWIQLLSGSENSTHVNIFMKRRFLRQSDLKPGDQLRK
jgi:hypothetical protein